MNAVALACALGAAACLAVASVLQHDAARGVSHDVGPLRLLLYLLRTPRWLVGRAIDTGALVLQAIALAHGSLIAVQAAVTSSVILALGMEAASGRRLVRRREVVGTAAVVAGIVGLLAVGRPDGADSRASGLTWVVIGGLTLLFAAGSLRIAGSAGRRNMAASTLAFATGVCFALDAASLKAAAHGTGGLWRVVAFGALFAAAALVGNVLVQRAFHLAPLNASLPVLTAVTPVAGAFAGIVLFHERLRPGTANHVVSLVAVVVLAGGAALAALAPPRHEAAMAALSGPGARRE